MSSPPLQLTSRREEAQHASIVVAVLGAPQRSRRQRSCSLVDERPAMGRRNCATSWLTVGVPRIHKSGLASTAARANPTHPDSVTVLGCKTPRLSSACSFVSHENAVPPPAAALFCSTYHGGHVFLSRTAGHPSCLHRSDDKPPRNDPAGWPSKYNLGSPALVHLFTAWGGYHHIKRAQAT